jgi:hypothetical protein
MVGSLMADRERVNPKDAQVPAGFWLVLALALLLASRLPAAIREGIVPFLLILEGAVVYWGYRLIKPFLTVMSWIDAGEYEQREWSLEERGFERGKMLVHLYRATNGDSSKSVSVEQLKQLGAGRLKS